MRNICVGDITLRLAAERGTFSLSFREKIELAKLLDRLELSSVELGPITDRRTDSLLVKSVAAQIRTAAVAVPVGEAEEGPDVAWNALKEAAHPRLQVVIPVSPAQMEYFHHRKGEAMLGYIAQQVSRCAALCPDVEWVAEDAGRAEPEFLYAACNAAAKAGARMITLCDSAGQMLPEECTAFVRGVRERIPEGIFLSVLCADTLSMSNACAYAALNAGADGVKTVSCGNAFTQTEAIVELLAVRGIAAGLNTTVRRDEIKRITKQIVRMCLSDTNRSTPFESGVRDSEEEGFTLSVHDGREQVMTRVAELGYELSEEDSAKVWEAFERIAARKGAVSARELDSIVASAAMQVPPTYRLAGFHANCGNLISASAHLKLLRGEETLEGVCLGDGPIDAAFLAIEQIIGHHYELDDFQIKAVTEGREAMGETLVRLRSGGKLYAGRGISTDIVGASIHAYLNALNKIVYEEA